MKSTFMCIVLAVAATLTFSALAQTGGAATPSNGASLPAAPSASGTPAGTPALNTGTKVGAINVEGAIFGSNEGQRDLQALQKKYEPKQAELKNQNDELEALKKQLSTQQDKLNEEALNNLKKTIEGKQKSFDRNVQDAQEEVGSQQQDIASRILQKMAPVIIKYAEENGFGMIIDTSKPWPQSPILMAGQGVDITPAVVTLYNAQSGVAAPAAATTAKPAAPKTGTPTPSAPATPKTNEP